MSKETPVTPTQASCHRQRPEHGSPRVVRCVCAVCGAHTNALKTFRVSGSCPNCGSFDLAAIEGADPMGRAPRAA